MQSLLYSLMWHYEEIIGVVSFCSDWSSLNIKHASCIDTRLFFGGVSRVLDTTRHLNLDKEELYKLATGKTFKKMKEHVGKESQKHFSEMHHP